jgi:pimeloyl-ACP methyl ester carboxylesterase
LGLFLAHIMDSNSNTLNLIAGAAIPMTIAGTRPLAPVACSYSVLAYDLRNHGRSGAGSGGIVAIGLLEYRDVIGSLRYAI